MRQLLLLLALLLPTGVVAGEEQLRGMKLDEIFAHAVKIGGFETYCHYRRGKCPTPRIVIRELPSSKDYTIHGRFEFIRPDEVSISSGLEIGSPKFTEVVFHEFIHYLDWMQGKIGPGVSCEAMSEGELKAYDMTSKFLARYGVKKDFAEQKMFHHPAWCLQPPMSHR